MRSLLISCWMCFICTSLAFAQSAEVSLSQSQAENQEVEKFSVHAQMTYINQMHNSFNSRYNGENSLLSRSEGSTGRSYSLSGTLFLGARLFEDTEVYYNPEMFSGSPFFRSEFFPDWSKAFYTIFSQLTWSGTHQTFSSIF